MKKLALDLRIPRKTGRILDVGSGNNCLDIATDIVDLMPDSDVERGGKFELAAGKRFQQGSLEALPYPDRHFDFIHTAHVLEHVENPARALSEAARVAPMGYIETPAAALEAGAFLPESAPGQPGWNFHRWMVWSFPRGIGPQGKLFIQPKTARSLALPCSCVWNRALHDLIAETNLAELDAHLPYYSKMTQLVWHERVEFELWTEDQVGRLDPRIGRCDCLASAFFAARTPYFRDWRQVRRRWNFRRRLPGAYRIYATTP